MKINNKGAALMQVLLIAVVLAGIATMLLRASLSRTISAHKTRRNVTAQMLIESCMSQVNALWAAKKPGVFYRDLQGPYMYCSAVDDNGSDVPTCEDPETTFVCNFDLDNNSTTDVVVTATISKDSNNKVQISYEITTGSDDL